VDSPREIKVYVSLYNVIRCNPGVKLSSHLDIQQVASSTCEFNVLQFLDCIRDRFSLAVGSHVSSRRFGTATYHNHIIVFDHAFTKTDTEPRALFHLHFDDGIVWVLGIDF